MTPTREHKDYVVSQYAKVHSREGEEKCTIPNKEYYAQLLNAVSQILD